MNSLDLFIALIQDLKLNCKFIYMYFPNKQKKSAILSIFNNLTKLLEERKNKEINEQEIK